VNVGEAWKNFNKIGAKYFGLEEGFMQS